MVGEFIAIGDLYSLSETQIKMQPEHTGGKAEETEKTEPVIFNCH